MNKAKRRVLIFIVAYNAEKTLAEVLNRIPAAVFDYDYRILIIDDSSSDQTFAHGLDYQRSHPDLNLEILFNPNNQGYGGDQKLGYTSTHTMALDDVEDGSHVLDLGCGQGRLATELKKKGCTIHGVDAAPLDKADALDRHTQLDLNRDAIEFPVDEYDVILLLDVIEHLQSPEAFLDALREKLKSKGTTPVIISVPNVAFLPVRMRLLLGDFQYGKRGILDLTHCRLFTESSLTNTLLECGYEIESVQGVPAPYPKAIGDNFVSRAMLAVNRALLNVSRGMFAYQIYVRARPLPTVPDLLEETRRTSSRLERSDDAAIRDVVNRNAK